MRRRNQKDKDALNYHVEGLHLPGETLEEFTVNKIEDGKLRDREVRRCPLISASQSVLVVTSALCFAPYMPSLYPAIHSSARSTGIYVPIALYA